jgi:ABC-type polar amino acid transport system ATPase subunit
VNDEKNCAAIKIVGLQKSFGAVQILRGVTLTIKQGEVAFIIGPSGGGKSTLLRCMNFLEKPDGGSIEFFGDRLCQEGAKGFDIRTERELRQARARMPMVFQQFNLFEHKTVLENLIEGPLVVLKEPREEAVENARRILRTVGLFDKQAAYPQQLSGGQKQRVGIARALAMRPDVILFDEPTSALDPELVADVLDTIKLLAEDGMTMVVVTHEMTFARNLADTVYFIEGGLVGEFGPPDQVIDSPRTSRVRSFVDAVLRH